jgi:hypothetical protein
VREVEVAPLFASAVGDGEPDAELFDQGMTLEAAARIVDLQDRLEIARVRIAELEAELGTRPGPVEDGR